MRHIILPALLSLTAQFAGAQEIGNEPTHPDLINPEPYDTCIDTLGEIFDKKAEEMDIDPMLLRNLYRGIIDEAAENSTAPEHEKIDIPSFNEKLTIMSPGLAEAVKTLTQDPTAVQKYFRDGCGLDI